MLNEIYVDNLKCGGCASTIKKKMESFDSVENININIEEGKITFDSSENLDVEEVKNSLAKAGYPERGTTNAFQKAKSYVSCAVGKMS